jgi:dihydroorotate dehydrogenase (NAD+) catalytic subunit
LPSGLQTSIGSLQLRNPTILAAGVLGIAVSSLRRCAEGGAGAVTMKSAGIQPREGYPNPTLVEADCGTINAMGLPNPGIQAMISELESSPPIDVPVIASIYGYSAEDYAQAARLASSGRVAAVELNVSCPHVEKVGREIGQSPELLAEIVASVKRATPKPVFVKLTPNVTDIVALAETAQSSGADAVVAINTLRAMRIEINTGRPLLANRVGGLSGRAIKPIAVRCVYEISKAVDLPVIGCGGVLEASDALEFLMAGASAVQIGTGIMIKGTQIFREICEGISGYMRSRGIGSVEEIVGLAHRY